MSNMVLLSLSSRMLIMCAVWAGGRPWHTLYHSFVHRGGGQTLGSEDSERKEAQDRARLAGIFWENLRVHGCVSVYRNMDTADMCQLSSSAVKLN